jgi:hypothetical protein
MFFFSQDFWVLYLREPLRGAEMINAELTKSEDFFFKLEDLKAFQIRDPKERVAQLRDTFFPRLELLVKYSSNLIWEIYGVNPDEQMTYIYRPSNRKDAEVNHVPDYVHVGLSGKRRNSKKGEPLSFTNREGSPIYIHPAHLTFDIYSEGDTVVSFVPFSHSVATSFSVRVCKIIQAEINLLKKIFENLGILFRSASIESSSDFGSLFQIKNFNPSNGRDLYSIEIRSCCYELSQFDENCRALAITFAALYPLLDLFIQIGDGKEPRLAEMLLKFDKWFTDESNSRKLDDSQKIFKPNNIEDVRKWINSVIVSRRGQTEFRRKLLINYMSQCAITSCNAEEALEAAHIIPYRGEATNHPSNGLLLRADVHTLFDLHLLTINPDDYSVILSYALLKTSYKELHGKVLRQPQGENCKPSKDALVEHHRLFHEKHTSIS